MTMHHLYDIASQRIVRSTAEPYMVDGKPGILPANLVQLVEVVIDRPSTEDGMTVDPITVIDTQAGTLTRGWSDPRPKTDAEAQTVSTQLVLYSSLTATERRTLRTMANLDDPVGDIALQIEGAFYSAVETESRNPRTKQLIGAAMQLGILKDIDRARELLNDPGFSIE